MFSIHICIYLIVIHLILRCMLYRTGFYYLVWLIPVQIDIYPYMNYTIKHVYIYPSFIICQPRNMLRLGLRDNLHVDVHNERLVISRQLRSMFTSHRDCFPSIYMYIFDCYSFDSCFIHNLLLHFIPFNKYIWYLIQEGECVRADTRSALPWRPRTYLRRVRTRGHAIFPTLY